MQQKTRQVETRPSDIQAWRSTTLCGVFTCRPIFRSDERFLELTERSWLKLTVTRRRFFQRYLIVILTLLVAVHTFNSPIVFRMQPQVHQQEKEKEIHHSSAVLTSLPSIQNITKKNQINKSPPPPLADKAPRSYLEEFIVPHHWTDRISVLRGSTTRGLPRVCESRMSAPSTIRLLRSGSARGVNALSPFGRRIKTFLFD